MVQFSVLAFPDKKIDGPYKVACKSLGTSGYIGYFSEPLNDHELAQPLYSTNTSFRKFERMLFKCDCFQIV